MNRGSLRRRKRALMRTWPRYGFVVTQVTWGTPGPSTPISEIVLFDADGFTLNLPRIALPETPSPA